MSTRAAGTTTNQELDPQRFVHQSEASTGWAKKTTTQILYKDWWSIQTATILKPIKIRNLLPERLDPVLPKLLNNPQIATNSSLQTKPVPTGTIGSNLALQEPKSLKLKSVRPAQGNVMEARNPNLTCFSSSTRLTSNRWTRFPTLKMASKKICACNNMSRCLCLTKSSSTSWTRSNCNSLSSNSRHSSSRTLRCNHNWMSWCNNRSCISVVDQGSNAPGLQKERNLRTRINCALKYMGLAVTALAIWLDFQLKALGGESLQTREGQLLMRKRKS